MEGKQIALSFKDLSVSSLQSSKIILNNTSGYVVKGGITAVLGASAAGKSVLLGTIAGRLPQLHISGELLIDGVAVDPNDLSNRVSYVPQDDFLLGELTPRETLKNIATMKTTKDGSVIDSDINHLLDSFGLSHVADNAIGTIFVRGLSGGQRKRVEVCSELIAPSTILLLDEPTSGLDGAIAYEILSAMKTILAEKQGSLSIIMSIHQPNSRILDLFDHILLLGSGAMQYFGTVPDSIEYFTSLGFSIPRQYTPTDVLLQLTDRNFGIHQNYDFEVAFINSQYAIAVIETIVNSKNNGKGKISNSDDGKVHDIEDLSKVTAVSSASVSSLSSFWRQYSTLIMRDFVIAARDPSLYYLQFVLVLVFGFLIGAGFFQLGFEIDSRITNVPSGLLWIVMLNCYVLIFKVYHLSRSNIRFKHEASNNTYSVFAYWLAELTTTSILLVSFTPGGVIAYFMMGLPSKAYPFLILLFWLTALTGETVLNLITKLTTNVEVAIVACLTTLVLLNVFGSGLFIAWNRCPDYWLWLQELAMFTQSSRSALIDVYDHTIYTCETDSDTCIGPFGETYPCDVSSFVESGGGDVCKISGRMVLYVQQGTIISESKWVPLLYLLLIFVCVRLSLLFLLYYPVEKVKFWIMSTLTLSNNVNKDANKFTEVAITDKNDGSSMTVAVVDSVTTASKDMNESLFVEGSDQTGYIIASGCCLEWKNLSVVLKKKGTILIDNVSGIALPGRILALMGPSGAGKTTLLNALSNRAPYAELIGEVTFGKRPFTPADLVYVPQFDELNQDLTVYEQIELVGNLKCTDSKDMYDRLDNLISIIGMTSKQHTLCKNLTSGELKRVSVGMGMIANPSVLFLDEPTTGLDSSAAYSIVKFLCGLSEATNVVIIMTIHQPAEPVFDMLQDLYILENGRLAFFGPLNSAERYFASNHHVCPVGINPADFYLDLVNKMPDEDASTDVTWCDVYHRSTFYKNYSIAISNTTIHSQSASIPKESPSAATRFFLLVDFFFKYYWRNIAFYHLRLLFLVIVAFFLGTIYIRLETKTSTIPQYNGALFFNIYSVHTSAIISTGLVASDRRLAVEQVKNAAITPGVYCLAQFIVSVPFNLFLAIIFQSVFHWLINMNPHGEAFIYAILITTGHLLLMESIMSIVVYTVKNAMLSLTLSMVVLGYLFLFAGFFVRTSDLPPWIGWISYLTPIRYSYNGYIWQILSNQKFDYSSSSDYQIDGVTILNDVYDLHHINSWGMFGVLLAWIILFRLTHYAIFAYEVLPYTTFSSKLSNTTTMVTNNTTTTTTTTDAVTTINKNNNNTIMKLQQSDGDIELQGVGVAND